MSLQEFWTFAETVKGRVFWRTEEHNREKYDVPCMWVTYCPEWNSIEVSLDEDIHYEIDEIKLDFTSLGTSFSKEEVEDMLSASMIGDVSSYDQIMDEIEFGTKES